jgi:NRAMP (natural resistance-associated macrophage protein)-like metal ion transporter
VSAPVQERLKNAPNPVKRLFLLLGPGLITGASDDDPSGIATYAQAGAALGLTTLWTALFTLPMMCAVQFMSAKIGMVTGEGLARVLRKHYPGWLLYSVVFALAAANTINAGVDLGAVAAAVNLVVPIPISRMVPVVAILIVAVQVFGSYRLITKVFKWLTLALFAYIAAAFLAKPHWHDVLVATVRPTIRIDRSFLSILVAILGTTITPYLFFWQADQEVEEETAMGRRSRQARLGATRAELRDARLDVFAGMLLSNLVMYFIILATASTLAPAGITKIQTATQAAQALRPIAGAAAEWLWAVALIGAGVLAVPILTGSTAFAITEAFAYKRGLDRRPGDAKLFYGVIVASTLIGMMINFAGINPIDALVWTAVINGFLAPPLLVILLLVANNAAVLGREVNGPLTNAVGWATTIVMFAAAIALTVYR